MSWIKQIPLSKDLDQANVIRCMSLDPQTARAVMELTTAVAIGGSMLEVRGAGSWVESLICPLYVPGGIV